MVEKSFLERKATKIHGEAASMLGYMWDFDNSSSHLRHGKSHRLLGLRSSPFRPLGGLKRRETNTRKMKSRTRRDCKTDACHVQDVLTFGAHSTHSESDSEQSGADPAEPGTTIVQYTALFLTNLDPLPVHWLVKNRWNTQL